MTVKHIMMMKTDFRSRSGHDQYYGFWYTIKGLVFVVFTKKSFKTKS